MSIANSKPVVPLSEGALSEEGEPPLEEMDHPPPLDQPIAKVHLDLQAGRRGQVDLETDRETLARYLRGHGQWIQRCFRPLQVEPLSADTYKLQFFRMGGLGFELEPCFGVKIWPEEDYLFRLTSTELPGEAALPYRVDCQASFRLEELPGSPATTRVHWDLHLDIRLHLPKFLQVLPRKLVQRVGSQVVQQVTRSLSDRFTHNVCSDFYCSIGRPHHSYRLVAVEDGA
ncbi:DUF1997 domain-containing protein [Synechococcus sp. H70.2]|uniref:DUF1997 domain-containing protein n=1 Tax=unclassified Synechococcus TaxID=2626047 RepID=UPI0039C2B6E1